jgi:uncharacterized protein YjiS (DUF1127 family)
MPATLSTWPAATKRPGTFSRLLSTCFHGIAGYFARRTATVTLRELDNRALRDIGLERSQIEAAVYGFIALSDQARM